MIGATGKHLTDYQHAHLVGIGGSGMSAIARILLHRGMTVSGSDANRNAMTEQLAERGATVHLGHAASNIEGADLVVVSTAIRGENPELNAASENGVDVCHRAQALAAIMAERRAVAVAGTHGKTTTTSMLGLMATTAGLDPTVLIGGELNDFGGNARAGDGEWVIAEADESDASFLNMSPDRIIVTNIEADHLDFYKDLAEIEATFTKFFERLRPGGVIVASLDSPPLAGLLASGAPGDREVITYSIADPSAMFFADAIEVTPEGGIAFTAVREGRELGRIALKAPGMHNVSNALGALACGLGMGGEFEAMAQGLSLFSGASRRFQTKGERAGVVVIDDYAHHPTEIAATLAAARQRFGGDNARRIVGLFQPHRYSRTRAFATDFGRALAAADVLIVAGVYSAGEPRIEGVSGEMVVNAAIEAGHADAHYIAGLDECRAYLAERLQPGDAFFTLGAGNVHQVGEELLHDLASRNGVA